MNKIIFNYLYNKAIQQPYFHLTGYMNRYWLVPYTDKRPGCSKLSFIKRPIARLIQLAGIGIRLHHILRSDDARAFHDHPWSFLTIILKGSYVEVTPMFESGIYIGDKRTVRKAGDFYFRRAKDWHRLEIESDKTVWTLFIVFKKTQEWGFLEQPSFKVYHRNYSVKA